MSQNTAMGVVEGFTAKYAIHRLLYFEETTDVAVALAREKQIKGWRRSKKVDLIRTVNPSWRDLSRGFCHPERSEGPL